MCSSVAPAPSPAHARQNRVAVLWFPDWPVQAAGLGGPAAVLQRRTVLACNPEARGFGVRRGMRVREAQALCTGLKTVEADVDCDARAFEPIVQGLDEVAASVEVLRPGLAVVALAGPARYFGGEPEAVERLLDAAARWSRPAVPRVFWPRCRLVSWPRRSPWGATGKRWRSSAAWGCAPPAS